MKHYPLLLLFSLYTSILSGQNYQPIQDSTLYSWGDYYSLRVQSANSGSGYDSYRLNEQAMRTGASFTEHYRVLDHHWAGKEILEYSNGATGFISSNDDTLLINPLAQVGQIVRAYEFPNGDYIEAEVRSVGLQSLFSGTVNDSVKVIGFQAFTSNGSPLSHIWNSQELKLSQNYGLFETLQLAEFPDTPSVFIAQAELSGYDNGSVVHGYEDLPFRDIFDFEVGMELHYNNSAHGCSSPTEFEYEVRVIKTVNWQGSNKVTITYDRYRITFTGTPPNPVPTLPYTSTLSETYNLGTYAHPIVNHPAGQPHYFSDFLGDWLVVQQNQATTIPGIPQKISQRLNKSSYDSTFYHQYDDNIMFNYSDETVYGKGLGVTRDFYQVDCSFSSSNLVYFKRKLDSWGTPWPHEGTRIINIEDPRSNPFELQIYPNPVVDQLNLSVNLKHAGSAEIRIYSVDGKMIRTEQWNAPNPGKRQFRFAPNLAAGIYVLEFKTEEGSSRKKFIVR